MSKRVLVYDIETIPQQNTLTPAQQDLLDRRLRIFSDDEDNPDTLRKLMATNSYLGQIACICCMEVATNKFDPGNPVKQHFDFHGDEHKILTDFWTLLGRSNDYLFVSYNGLGFDVPWILRKSMQHKVDPTNRNFLFTKRYSRWPHYDVMQVLADWDKRATVTLDLACEAMGIPTPKDGDIKAATVEAAYRDGNIQGIVDYCRKDLDATYKLYQLVDKYQPK